MAIFTQEARHEKAKMFYNGCFDGSSNLDVWFCIAKKLESINPDVKTDTWGTNAPYGWSSSWSYDDTDIPSPAVYPLSTYPYNNFNPDYDSSTPGTVAGDKKGLPGAMAYIKIQNILFCRPLTSADIDNMSNLNLIYYLNSYYAVVDPDIPADMEKYKPSLLCVKCCLAPGMLDSGVETGKILQIGIYKGLVKKSGSTSASNIALPSDFDVNADPDSTQGSLMIIENIVPHQRLAYNQDTRLFMLQF